MTGTEDSPVNPRAADAAAPAVGRRAPPGGAPLLTEPSSTLAACTLVCLAYSAAGAAGVWLLQQVLTPAYAGIAASVGMPWLSAGIGVAGLLMFGVRAWPGVFAGSCVTWGLVQGDAWPMVLLGAASESASIVLMAWLLGVWDFRVSLERYRDALLLIAAAALGRIVTSGTDVVGLIVEVWFRAGANSPLILDEAGVHRSGDVLILNPALLAYAFRWWANTTSGVILVVPLLAFLVRPTRPRDPGTVRERVLWSVGSLVWLAAALTIRGAEPRLPLIAGALVLVIWAAVRFGVAMASTGTLVFSMAAAVGFALQLGTFAGIAGREGTEVAWGFIGVLSGTALLLTALLAQRERAQHAIAASADRYRRLFVSNPYPMWAEDGATGRILVANPSALREYGYAEAQFLGLRGHDLVAEPDALRATRPPDGHGAVTSERHRTSHGTQIDVEVTRAPVDFAGRPARVCFVEPMSERNAMRLAALSATDLERFRLGGTIATQLIPVLSQIAGGAHRLGIAVDRQEAPSADLLASLSDDVAAAIRICKGVTRGASPLLSADGDLAESFRLLPASLPGLAVNLTVSIPSTPVVKLPLERREHVYRLVEDAVRAAAARPDVSQVAVSLDTANKRVRVMIADDGHAASGDASADDLSYRSMAARAAAAGGHLRVASNPTGGTVTTFECEPDAPAGPERDALPSRREELPAVAADDAAADAEAAAPGGSPADSAIAHPMRRWLGQVGLLALAYTAAAALGLAFVREIDALNVSYHAVRALPWVAAGVAVVGVMLGGPRLWPAVFAGYVLIWRVGGDEGWPTVMLGAAAQAAAVVVTVHLLRRFGFRRAFDRMQDCLALVGAAVLGRALVIPADLIGLQLADVVSPLTISPEMRDVIAPAHAEFLGFSAAKLEAVARWWLNGVAGIVLVVPALLSWSRPIRDVARRQGAELLTWTLALAGAGAALLTIDAAGWRLPILALGLAVVTWAAVRFGTGVASMATLLLSLAATASFGLARGTLAPTGPDEGLSML